MEFAESALDDARRHGNSMAVALRASATGDWPRSTRWYGLPRRVPGRAGRCAAGPGARSFPGRPGPGPGPFPASDPGCARRAPGRTAGPPGSAPAGRPWRWPRSAGPARWRASRQG
ncbi:hypothetical protein P3766_09435 [Pseudomonas aeruginosa]|nr:hypothetical protein [Pseudomonas aeruginosa]